MSLWLWALILIPIAAILIVALIFVLVLIYRNKKYLAIIENLKDEYSESREYSIGSTMNRIQAISEFNPAFSGIAKTLDAIHSEFVNNFIKGRKLIGELRIQVRKMKFSSKEANKLANEIKANTKKLEELENNFRKQSEKITHQDEALRKEFSFYQRNLRGAVNAYKNKRILLDSISPSIDKLNIEIKQIEKEFEIVIDKADVTKASIIIQKYILKIIKFIKVINEGPAINAHLREQIPKAVRSLTEFYQEKKSDKNLSIPLAHIQFQKSVKRIAGLYERAKASFNKLDLKNAKANIIKVLKGFRTIESQINLEIRSRNAFIQNYKNIITYTKDTLQTWINVNKDFKEIIGSGKSIDNSTMEQYNSIRSKVKSLDLEALNLQEIIKDKNFPYSTKIQRSKEVVQKSVDLINNINELNEAMWESDNIHNASKQKFLRSQSALYDLAINIKELQIALSEKEKTIMNELVSEKEKIQTNIKNITDKKMIEKIEDFSKKTTSFYSLIGGNIQLSFHIKNLLNKYAPLRHSNEKLNHGFQLVEKQFLDGAYAAALNIAVDTIKEMEN